MSELEEILGGMHPPVPEKRLDVRRHANVLWLLRNLRIGRPGGRDLERAITLLRAEARKHVKSS